MQYHLQSLKQEYNVKTAETHLIKLCLLIGLTLFKKEIFKITLVVQKMFHTMHRSKGKHGYFIMKVELAKAYDKIGLRFVNQ